MGNLTKAQQVTLAEMKTNHWGYVFRQATCRELLAMGLCRINAGDKRKRPAYFITEAGRAALARAQETRP